jgi:prepilin-type N-terminal cleavage/methylation domain-containing protein
MVMNLHCKKGFSYVELMVTIAIISLMAAGGFAALSAGEASWFTAEASIQVQENLRKALDHITAELRESQLSQVSIAQGTGFNATDIVTFSIPVICHTGDNLLNANGDVAHWGATLRWGCRDAACMDLNNTCSSVEYKFIQYEVVAGNQLVRKVLNNVNTVMRQEIVANNIADFQARIVSGSLIELILQARVTSVLNRPVQATVQNNITFRNR